MSPARGMIPWTQAYARTLPLCAAHTVSCQYPLRTCSEKNRREHWAVRQRRTRCQRQTAYVALLRATADHRIPLPVTVTLTRLAPRMLDTDNLAMSLSAVRDGTADALGLDNDTAPGLVWVYQQERAAQYGVRVALHRGEEVTAASQEGRADTGI